MKLKRYIQGDRKGKDANRIERDALKDPFLYEALEGFDAVEGDHAKRIEELQGMITRKAAAPVRRPWLRWSAAASVLLLISFGGYLYMTNGGKETKSLISQNIESETPIYPSNDTKHEIQDIQAMQSERIEQSESVKEQVAVQEDLAQNKSKTTARISQESAVVASKQIESKRIEEEDIMAEIIAVEDIIAEKLSGKISGISIEKAGIDSSKTTIGGIITDQNGEPLVGVYITQKGTTIGAISNAEGVFELKVDTIKGLNVNYIGYLAQEISATQLSNSMKITLVEDQSALAEAVVVAYGAKKRSATIEASVSQIEIEESNSQSEPVIGKKAYEQYLKTNMIHPLNEQGKKIKGRVKLSFYIDPQGRPINITIEKSLTDAADAEAIRLIKEGADWTLSSKKIEWSISF